MLNEDITQAESLPDEKTFFETKSENNKEPLNKDINSGSCTVSNSLVPEV